MDIKNYATNHILLSKDIEYDFVHSSNCKLQSPEKFSAETEAEAYYRFLVWLKEEKSIRKNKKNQVNKITWRDVFIDEEHYTKALEIFDIVIDKNSKISSHAFVFHILRKNLYLKDIKHKVYIEFLKENYDVIFSENKITTRKSAYQIKLINQHFPELSIY